MRGARTVYARAISDPASLNFDVIGSEQPVSNFGVIGPKAGHGAWVTPPWWRCTVPARFVLRLGTPIQEI